MGSWDSCYSYYESSSTSTNTFSIQICFDWPDEEKDEPKKEVGFFNNK